MASQGETAKEFGAKIGQMMVHGFSLLSVSLANQVGLFDVLASQKGPKTSQEIADAGDFKERYVRELLGALVMSRIVELDSTPSGDTFFLPEHRRAFLVQESQLNDAVLLSGMVAGLGGEPFRIVKECFKKDGPRGVPYASYKGMDFLDKVTSKFIKNHLIPDVICSYPELKSKLDDGASVLDVGCGYGTSTTTLATAFPKSTFLGFDILEESIKGAEAKAQGMTNVTFEVRDASKLPPDWTAKFDVVLMHDAFHDQARPDRTLGALPRVMTEGAIFLMIEPSSHTKMADNRDKLPGMEILYTISTLHCMPVSLYFEDGLGLGACWGRERAVEMLQEAGFEVIAATDNGGGRGQHFCCRKR